jgi:uncharacterized protein (DUF58 family)
MAVTVAADQAASRRRFLDLPALAALAHRRFATKHQIEGSYSGRHRSRQQGGAAEFVDYREYTAGEDLRRLDWKVLARTGRPYIRLYQDETDLSCMLVLDASGSMDFGSHGTRHRQSKLEYVQYLATALSHVISRQQDQVGLAVISDALREVLAPGATNSHLQLVQGAIEQVQTRPRTDLAGGLRDLFARLTRRGVLMIMSDFLVDDASADPALALEQTFSAIRLFRHRRWEVILLHIVHPEEERLPEGLAYRFEGLENEGQVDCSPADVKRLYEERFAAHCAAVRGLALASGCDYHRVATAIPYLQTLGSFLVDRSG